MLKADVMLNAKYENNIIFDRRICQGKKLHVSL
jgi:hypothetical protein